ncbi:ABC transporter substrate-binding protein [Vineibacter terrae]|uniref:ABC transporter substrate-binding protein n=1 Tax=Vineibacter terrae TaxID=2586908 RepID=UPI002E30A660|nr:ABC transporter substrate-binding protein [Vineibacter terrae]HEX2888240.1 ABC transporter substrate-binding protein [Vineibacter terrae]
MATSGLSRRAFQGLAAGAALAAPFVRGAHAAGKLSMGFWDHWVPGANQATTDLVNAWAAKEKVDVQIDYITSQGNKNRLTIAAEAQAKAGHDIMALPSWEPADKAKLLEPLDELMGPLIEQNGAVDPTVAYLGKADGHWICVPATVGSQIKGPCSRIDLLKQHADVDIQALYPAGSPAKAEGWTMDAYLKAAQACHKAGFPFGIGVGGTADSVDSAGAIFSSFGAVLVDGGGNITVKSDAVRQALDYYKQLVAVMPPDIAAWDDASNNKWLVSGKGASIMNPPSAWAVAKRDAPQIAEQLWTHGMPAGPKGRYAPFVPYFWGVWSFSRNKSAAKSLLMHLSQASSVEKMVAASGGYDLPSFAKLTTFKTWAEEGPPKGTLYHYPNPHNHQVLSMAGAPAPPKIAVQIYTQAIMTKMVARYAQGEAMEKTLNWAASELEGFMRT